MTEVNYVIEKGQPIPDDVIGLLDRDGDELVLNSIGHWHSPGCTDPATCDRGPEPGCGIDPTDYAPLTVTAVREPAPEQAYTGGMECPVCGSVEPHNDHEPEPPQIEVVATTRVGGADVPIYAEVPERPVERAGWPEETDPAGNGCRYFDELLVALDAENVTSALADIKRLKSDNDRLKRVQKRTEAEDLQVIAERDDYHEWADRLAEAITEHLGVDIGEHSNANLPWQAALIALTDAKPADPSVLSLPQVPPGTVGLIGGKTGERFSKHDGWWEHEPFHALEPRRLGALLDDEGSVTVVKREPRTWPLIDGAPDGVQAVKGASGNVWRRSDGVTEPPLWCWEDESYNRHGFHPFALVQHVDGPLTEVFDEPGGAS